MELFWKITELLAMAFGVTYVVLEVKKAHSMWLFMIIASAVVEEKSLRIGACIVLEVARNLAVPPDNLYGRRTGLDVLSLSNLPAAPGERNGTGTAEHQHESDQQDFFLHPETFYE